MSHQNGMHPHYISFNEFVAQHSQNLYPTTVTNNYGGGGGAVPNAAYQNSAFHNNNNNNNSNINVQLRATAAEFVPRELSLPSTSRTNNYTNITTTSMRQDIEDAASAVTSAHRRRRRPAKKQNINGRYNNQYVQNATLQTNNDNMEQNEGRASGNNYNRHKRGERNNGNRNNNRSRNNPAYAAQTNMQTVNGHSSIREETDAANASEQFNNKNVNNNGLNGQFAALKVPKLPLPQSQQTTQREKLMNDIEKRRLECLVCVEYIRDHHFTWSCESCFHVMHLKCIREWAKASKSDIGWRCPACQHIEMEIPTRYLCFCGRKLNPHAEYMELAHSCGEMCSRKQNCAHPCTQLCHPGKCPPCQASVNRSCNCGRAKQLVQCYVKSTIECGAICDKPLNCKRHNCEQKCHDGPCAVCAVQVKQQCYCSADQREIPCTIKAVENAQYTCQRVCGKDLTCGNHQCEALCHEGACQPCRASIELVKTCPCGKQALAADVRKSCLDPIPKCQFVCGKTLICGGAIKPHKCISKCHTGPCPPCNKQTEVKCRCGNMLNQKINCRQLTTRADDVRCKKRCTKLRACGRHKCNQDCCIDFEHLCPLNCTRTLSCGKHKCEQTCHRGNCQACPRVSFEELFCECGRAVIYPPVPCGTKRPKCTAPCSRQHSCDHVPQHVCHSENECPPCVVLTTKSCYGGHEQRKTIPCHQGQFSCGMPCCKPLRCGRHKCIKKCHNDECETESDICKQNCPLPRPQCGHKCNAACHDGDCPDTKCKELIEVQCECGNRKQMRVCDELTREFSRITTAQLASSMMANLDLNELLAPVKMKGTTKTLDCNDECRLIARNKRLEIALGPSITPIVMQTKYSKFLLTYAKRQPDLVKTVYKKLMDLVNLSKGSQQKSRSHSFPIMNREKRQMVHELCTMFGIESISYDNEPNRNVVATAYKGRCWMPSISLMEVVQRESGQRRVAVPSNNAWEAR